MQRIQLLDTKTINKIAAGEVVESPKSVVKELVENAVDAGATAITVEIKEGGISYIRITDNGRGIPGAEVKNAFLRHATSKMSQIEDLEHIFTLGFRGEALASIAAVSQMEMLTKTQDEEMGTQIEISAGEVKLFQPSACREGTAVTVKNLFYNVPARRKFLKKPATESGYVSDLLHRLALGHPQVSFRYINNETTLLHTTGNGDLKTAIFYVYGKDVANAMLPVSYQKGEYTLSGMIGKPELSRGNRSYENLFINGRFIKNSVVAAAVEDAFKTRLLVGKFPVFVLNLEVEPSQVDVNVHPAKLEVRFKNDDEVYEFFYNAVAKTLEQQVLIPQVSWDQKSTKKKELPPIAVEQQTLDTVVSPANVTQMPPESPDFHVEKSEPTKPAETHMAAEIRSTPAGMGKTVDQLLKKRPEKTGDVRQAAAPFYVGEEAPPTDVPSAETTAKAEVHKAEPFFRQYKIIGQIFLTYWVVEQGDCLYLIDQHAAHERILFEELMQRFQKESIPSQRLLAPLMLNLTELEGEVLKDNLSLLESFGFELEIFGGNVYALKAVPYLMQEPSSAGFFTEILDSLSDQHVRTVYDYKLLAVATMACKAAVKGHDHMSVPEAAAMIERLLKLENPFSCPHGRPTIIEMTKYELEKKFKRIQS